MAAEVGLTDRESSRSQDAEPASQAQPGPRTGIEPGFAGMMQASNGDPEKIAEQMIYTGRTQDPRIWNQIHHTLGNAYALRIREAIMRQRQPSAEGAHVPEVAQTTAPTQAARHVPEAPVAQHEATPAQGPAPTPGPDGVLAEQVERNVLGVTITAPAGVRPGAIDECARVIHTQVGDNEHAQQRFERARVSIVIIPAHTAMTDIPELARLRGKKTFDGRDWSTVRGMGGVRTPNRRFSIAVAEESVTQVADVKSAYPATYSVAMHELAHVLRSRGMTRQQRHRVERLYREHQRRDPNNEDGTWTDQYGSENPQEYFAQATNTFFGRNGMGENNNGRAYLQRTDPEMYALCVEMYDREQDQHGDIA